MSQGSSFADEEFVRFLAQPVPRQIPASIRKPALKQAAPLVGLIMGGFFMLFGLFFVSVFFPKRIVDELRLSRGETETVAARVVAEEKTRMTVNKTRVMCYTFELTTLDGRRIGGECFTTGHRWSVGKTVPAHYLKAKPEIVCLEGARLSEGTLAAGGIVLIFPVIGAGFVVGLLISRYRMVSLLRSGPLGDFRVTAIETTSVRINRMQQYRITFQRIDDASDTAIRTVKWHHPQWVGFARERMRTGQAVFGLFDPKRLKRIVLPEIWSVAKN